MKSRTIIYTINSDIIIRYVSTNIGHRKTRPDQTCTFPGTMVAMAIRSNKPPQDLQRMIPIFQSMSGNAHWNQRNRPLCMDDGSVFCWNWGMGGNASMCSSSEALI